MKSVLIRTGSVPVQSPHVSGSRRVCLSRNDLRYGVFSSEKSNVCRRSNSSLHFDVNRRGDKCIRRVMSENDVVILISGFSGGSGFFPAKIPEEEYHSEGCDDDIGGPLSLKRSASFIGVWPEVGFSGDGFGKGSESDGGGFGSFGGGNSDKRKMGEYYREMLKTNPSDSLLLRNYGKFLHEVEKDTVGAEEYYGRAILASPGDGELLSLYGKLIWETHRDEDRARSYFDRAVSASPDDCMVLGSYANFMWQAEEDEDEDEEINEKNDMSSTALVAAF
ncbi:hypothetical protein FNV43_RR10144 [Rhamnella rubrinervis]|uniref:TmcB/TmcC TPR repeats domain-containing protein n=1 Tax=Rhamnella rubrinervis TaxID=2594499 RepID=A0A8K0HB84_9ROSA|nr:hypothetical protein FNV43_RR10144 [Rhamnella rubrinervis]